MAVHANYKAQCLSEVKGTKFCPYNCYDMHKRD